MRKFIIIIIFITVIAIINQGVLAVPMDSSSFKIESANVEVAGGNKSSSNYKLADTIGQLAAGQYSSDG